ncbi:MAG: DNA repair protein RadA [Salinisphaeraceae bacterium]|nr:DNA repair protein RadA [Salinisphaeraceae bacterium]
MAKSKTIYTCEQCGGQQPKWAGQCPDCGAWNSLAEGVVNTPPKAAKAIRARGYAGETQVRLLKDVALSETPRTHTGLKEMDRVLGGGLVPGSVTLIGGDPGIGKSTLLLQVLVALQEKLAALYITGEESLEQVHLRARRLGLPETELGLLAETCVERILDIAEQAKPQLLVIDSVQTIFSEEITSAPGSVSQLRESAAALVRFAKQTGTAVILVGHVTKEGVIAGPRVLEHMVDTVLYFETDRGNRYRVIRAAKNRFGAVNELGVFAMTDAGLKEVSNPSAIFLSRHSKPVSGSIVMVTREGSRPMLVEVQALVDESHLNNPRRVTLGPDANRLAMLLAVLHRHGGIAMADQDVFVNVVGGMRVTEPAADLPVLLAALSSLRDRPIAADMVAFGELGLSGEIRPVQGGEERIKEAAKHGFKRAIVPKANAPRKPIEGIEVMAVERLSQALDLV